MSVHTTRRIRPLGLIVDGYAKLYVQRVSSRFLAVSLVQLNLICQPCLVGKEPILVCVRHDSFNAVCLTFSCAVSEEKARLFIDGDGFELKKVSSLLIHSC